MKVKVTTYVHGDKESMYDLIESEGLVFKDKDAERTFSFANSEIEIELEVDLETGETKILSAK